MTALATLIAVPIGIGVALYLVEYGRQSAFANVVRYFIDVMTGVPSIVFGLFIYISLVINHVGGASFAGWKGSVAVSLLMLPVVTRSAEVVLLLVPDSLREAILTKIIEPSLRGLSAEDIVYQGFLYFGLMLTKAGPKVLEFNCRLGDPEAQAIVARMDFDLAEVLADVATSKLDPVKLRWKAGASVCIVLASGGYPGKFESGKPITGLTDAERLSGVKVFHAGTKLQGDSILTAGGRVLGVTAAAASLDYALTAAYEAAAKIYFEGMHYRKDIAKPTRVSTAGQ
jgi:hypothetical protein